MFQILRPWNPLLSALSDGPRAWASRNLLMTRLRLILLYWFIHGILLGFSFYELGRSNCWRRGMERKERGWGDQGF